MASVNNVVLMGNLTKDPEVRQTPSGTAVGDLRLAVSEKFKNKEGETVESTCYADIVVWGRQAETCQQYLTKGCLIAVEGRLQLDEWQTEAGEKRSRLRIRAHRVQFLRRPKNGNNGGDPAGEAGHAEPEADEMPF
jgi:single-strand DNA-binding protein